MPVPISYYVNITSGVGASENIPARQLVPLFFDDNALIPSGSYVNFPNNGDAAANVAAYFGASSTEYKRALFAFGWISKNISVVPSISFARWNSAACPPVIYGDADTTTTVTGTWTSITSGTFELTMGTFNHTFTGLDFSGITTLANVATIIQSAVQSYSAGGSLWTGATVSYDSGTGRFNLVGGSNGTAPISITSLGAGDVAVNLGWEGVTTIFGPGAPIQTITNVLQTTAALNNNYGSFGFIATLDTAQITEAATVNHAMDVEFLYSIPCTASTATAIQTAVSLIGDCTTTLTADTTQYEEQIPMMIMAATNYNGVNTTQNYMFQQFAINPSVTSLSVATAYDAIGVNYYANTQQAGQIVNLYQRGQMNGLPVDPAAQNTYANEVWLKGAMTSALFTLLLALNKISANNMGQSQVLAICQSVIQTAITNGTISVGETLNATQILYITNATGSATAWQTVQNQGYILSTNITSQVVNAKTQYIINYTLIYAQDNVVNKITSADILI